MNKEQLYDALDYVNHSREKRMEMAMLISENPQLIKPLLEIAFEDKNPISSKACWVMEFTAKENLPYLFPYLNQFTKAIGLLKLDSSVRPMAKICEYLIKGYFQKKHEDVRTALNEVHLEEITSACFDWLIGNHKVAAQAYSMTCLLLLGRKFDWIHPELKMTLEKNYAAGSAAYKARARMTLEKIKN
ncbi:adenylosuccinate lyase [Maribacter algarum]|uniref:Adenylosuccinate lyase n=1 Tax=Maribacter algarum (ex Zhang et al. 2020) TaxID=2578118 RepID=A0A5S3PHE7_9FLAO|nr:adenylosuccinate lyase [Maribacter algarum]TMM53669.1 adenylosuccinate lyase [Maribacter algarum]